MSAANPGKREGTDVALAQWRWTNFKVAMLSIWAFLSGANLVRLAGAIDAQERWLGPALAVAVSVLGIVFSLHAARPVRDKRPRGPADG